MLKISKQLKIYVKTVKKVLIENNIQIKSNSFYKSKNIDENYFCEIDTQNKAYVLGYLFADGCLTNKKTLSMSCSKDNLESLQIIKKELQSSCKIGEYINNNGFIVNNKYYKFSVCNQKIYNDLLKAGMIRNKSLTIAFPSCISKELEKHFIRGYFDGNGSVYYTINHNNYISPSISFSGNKKILETINEILNKELNSSTTIHPDKTIYTLKYGGQNIFRQVYNYLYEDSNLFLGRKKKKFENILDKIER